MSLALFPQLEKNGMFLPLMNHSDNLLCTANIKEGLFSQFFLKQYLILEQSLTMIMLV